MRTGALLGVGAIVGAAAVCVGIGASTRVEAVPPSLPPTLREAAYSLRGLDCTAVLVHANAPNPAAIAWDCANAFDWASPTGVGRCVSGPRGGWHVVQQREGRVTPTFGAQANAVEPSSDAAALEEEATRLGEASAER